MMDSVDATTIYYDKSQALFCKCLSVVSVFWYFLLFSSYSEVMFC